MGTVIKYGDVGMLEASDYICIDMLSLFVCQIDDTCCMNCEKGRISKTIFDVHQSLQLDLKCK